MTDPRDIKFEPLDFRKRSLSEVMPNQYRVLSRAGEIKEIEANTAYEAFRQSGLSEAIKIERIFITNRNVIPLEDFSDNDEFLKTSEFDEAFGGAAMDENDPLAHFRRRKNPIISPVELDALMRALHAMEHREASPAEDTIAGTTETEPQATPQRHIPEDHNERVSVPAPAPEPQELQSMEPGLTGLDIHGDGFDEIIPVPAPSKLAPAAKPVHTGSAQQQAPEVIPVAAGDAPPIPERELSAEEIDALLNK
jgi:hypothetical protein